jgi:nitrate/nitrite transporter NarK
MSAGGWIADRFGPRAVLAVTGFGAALLTGLTSICGNPGLGAGFCRHSSCMAVTMRTKFVAV